MNSAKLSCFLCLIVTLRCGGFVSCVEQLCSSFKRSFTVLDVLQNNGDTARQLMGRWSMCYVLMQSGICWCDRLSGQLVVLDHRADLETLQKLESCEDVDIVLADVGELRVDEYEQYLLTIGNLSLFSVVANIPEGFLQQFLSNHSEFLLCACNENVVVLQRIGARILLHNAIDDQRERNYIVYSTRESKFMYKPSFVNRHWRVVCVPWHPGINLQTFCALNGVIPSRPRIIDLLYQKFTRDIEDPFVRNVILQGDQIIFIDCKNDKAGRYDLSYQHRLYLFGRLLRTVDPAHKRVNRVRLFAND